MKKLSNKDKVKYAKKIAKATYLGMPMVYDKGKDLVLHGDSTAHTDDAKIIKAWFNEDVIDPPFKNIKDSIDEQVMSLRKSVSTMDDIMYVGNSFDDKINDDHIKREIVMTASITFLAGLFIGAFTVYLCILLL